MGILDLIDVAAIIAATALTFVGYRRRNETLPHRIYGGLALWLLAALCWLIATCADVLDGDWGGWMPGAMFVGCLFVSWKVAQRAAQADGDVR